jgi:hypothetical protein
MEHTREASLGVVSVCGGALRLSRVQKSPCWVDRV